jgi:hypothetical protein
VEPDPVLQAVSLFGARVRGHGSDFDTPALRAWLEHEARADVPPSGPEPEWRTRARAVERRLPPPAQRVVRGLGRRIVERVRS